MERSTQYTSFSSRQQPANAGTERKQFTENASMALQQVMLTHARTKCPPVLLDIVKKGEYCLTLFRLEGGGFSNPPSGKIVITPTPKEL